MDMYPRSASLTGRGSGGGTHASQSRLPLTPSDVRPSPRRPRGRDDWRDKHLRCCLQCGRVWRRRRRRTCPGCGRADLAMCLTCDRVTPESTIRDRCSMPSEDLRRLVKLCAGDWEWAGRALVAARGDVARALVAVGRRRRPAPSTKGG